MKKFIKDNSLSIAFIILFIATLAAQVYFGHQEYNKELTEDGGTTVSLAQYFTSGHFVESTFENWESEFLQMALFVVLTIFLKQKGSSESKKFDGTDDVDQQPDPAKEGAPWPVKKGGFALSLYKHSLTIALLLLFIISFVLHFYGSLADENTQNQLKGKALATAGDYISDSRFWFESFQNWQSEFLSVFAIVALSIYLRQQGSPQSKPVNAPHDETGE
jgi:surface polysaccharide O-acyltransferase-like enzyme